MATSVTDLENQILAIIKEPNFNIATFLAILSPISAYISDPQFVDGLNQIIQILTQNRDGTNQFSITDLELLAKDPLSLTSLISALILTIGAIPELKLEYNSGATEEIILKLLAYIFFVLIPQATKTNWTLAEKQNILSIAITIYEFLQSSTIVQEVVQDIINWFKSKGCNCGPCASTTTQKTAVVSAKMPKVKRQLTHAISSLKDKSNMLTRINKLENKINKKTSKK